MPARPGVQVVFNRLPAIQATLLSTVETTVATAAANIERDAKLNTDVQIYNTPESPRYKRTGGLKAEIRAERTGPAQWTITAGKTYSALVEYGTRYVRARPFMIPAATANFPKLQAELQKLLGSL